jgi:hypothetical protein
MKNHIISCNFLDFYDLSFTIKGDWKVCFPWHLLSGRIFSNFPATLAGKFRNNLATMFVSGFSDAESRCHWQKCGWSLILIYTVSEILLINFLDRQYELTERLNKRVKNHRALNPCIFKKTWTSTVNQGQSRSCSVEKIKANGLVIIPLYKKKLHLSRTTVYLRNQPHRRFRN